VFEALNTVVEFLRENEIMTIEDWANPADYTGFASLEELDERIAREGGGEDERLLPENSSIDTKVRQREMLPGETHEYIGHMLDDQRQEQQTFSPIRHAGRRFNMGSRRSEGWAVALEELLMQVGVLDDRPRRGREMEYLMNASHMSLAIPDMKMHANEIDLTEARHLCAEIMPRGWSRPDERMVWFEMQSNIRNPGGFHSNVVTGKAYFMKLFRERAQELDEEFVLRDFIDEFLASGIIPMSLIRWEMTGNNDDVILVTEEIPGSGGSDPSAAGARSGGFRSRGDQLSESPPGMVLIPGGSFLMGNAKGLDQENPVHEVVLDGFHMETHEVTLREFGEFIEATGYVTDAEKGGGSIIWDGGAYVKTEGIDWRYDAVGERHPQEHESQPVTHTSWNDADAYCRWAGKRLPTEAEWEYAARGGEKGYEFAWGDEPLGDEVVANVSDESFVKVVTTWPHFEGYDDGYIFGAPVGSFPPNSLGLYDMAGNAWEWCADYFDEDFYRRSPTMAPRNDVVDERRAMRGNSWDGRPGMMRASRCTSDLQANSYADTGFRCVKDL
jgi:formylglycine-generating enzyme required for sulfatase activity